MDIEQGIEIALDGNAIMFAGAGCSSGAINLRGKTFLLAGKLASYLADKVGMPQDTQLEDAAEGYISEYGEDALISEIRNEYTAKMVAEYHIDLGKIPWKRIYTTNYDNVLEESYKHNSKRLYPIMAYDNPRFTSVDATSCVHLNGYVENLERGSFTKELKLTETSYLTSSLTDSPWIALFREDIRFARAVFFLGYSLFDLDIRRILMDSPDLKEKCIFILGEKPNATVVRHAERFGSVLPISIKNFAMKVKNKSNTYIPIQLENLCTLAVPEYLPPDTTLRITDIAFLELLLYGQCKHEMVSESLKSGQIFLLERKANDRIFNEIKKGKRIIVIHSDMGNGKSMLLERLQIQAIEYGYRVFKTREPSDEATLDIQKIARMDGKILVIIEEYQRWLKEIETFKLTANDNAVLLLTARSTIHDVVFDDLDEDVPEICVNILSSDEINWFINAFDTYGLWGEFAGKSHNEKFDFITYNCKSQIHALLLKIMNSPDIGNRLRQLVNNIKLQKHEYEIFLSCCILTILSHSSDYETLVDIWGPDVLGDSGSRRSTAMKQLVDLNRNEVLIKSPIAAQHILTSIADPALTISIMSYMAKKIHNCAGVSGRFDRLIIDFLKFSNIQLILPDEGKSAAVIHYYESIKNLDRCRNSPLFWLQYGIACLSINDLSRSKRYFDTAYSLAKNTRFETYQIDNHYARLLLVEANGLDVDQAMDNFRAARTIINRQIMTERRDYPYRVACLYQPFLDRFGSSLSIAQTDELGKAANNIQKRIDNLSTERKNNKYIKNCIKAMKYVIAITSDRLSLNESAT